MEELSNQADLDDLLGASRAILLKHGATCSISANARREVEALAAQHPELPVLALEVTQHGELADVVASQLGVPHQSPQVFVVRDGAVAWHASHFDITKRALEEQLDR